MDKYLHWIIVGFAWVWVKIHDLVSSLGLGAGGAGWVLSIVILTLLVRTLILPLYIKQIKSQRGMQALQPELQKLQAKYKGKKDQASRQKQSEEMMALYKKNGTSPYSSCLPMLVQMPVLFALYRVIFAVQTMAAGDYQYDHLGPLTHEMAKHIAGTKVFGVGLFETFNTTQTVGNKALFLVMIVLMVGFQFFSMQMGMKRNMPPSADPNNPMVRSQKTMLFLMPGMFAFTGFIFQMALLVYMVTTAVFSWAQQLWVIKVMPTPGAPAYEELAKKRQDSYQAWAKPYFDDYMTAKLSLKGDEEAISELNHEALAAVEAPGRKARIFSTFPEEWTAADKVALYHDLAREEWEVLPDENWFKDVLRSRRPQEQKQNRVAKQPKKLSREQRMRRAEQQKGEGDAAGEETGKPSSPRGELTPEEIERRRQEKRAERRAQNKSGKKKK